MRIPDVLRSRGVRLLLLAVLVGGGVVLSALRAADKGPGSDFHAKWMAGHFFRTGEAVYVERPGVRGPPTYPPFAAMTFQVLTLLPLEVAAGVFYFCNLVLTVLAFALTHRVFRRLWPARGGARWPFVGAGVASAQFYLNNLNLLQIDALLFVLVLLGILAHLDGRDVAAAGMLVAATAIKIVPMFFIAWLLIRGRTRTALAAVVIGVACVALPLLWRGIDRGVADLREYHALVLKEFRDGRIVASYTNQNLGAAIHRLTRPPQKPQDWDYRVVSTSEATTQAVYRAGILALLLGLVGTLVALRLRAEPVSVFELSAVLLTGHLVSALTWKSHLVTLLFVVYAFLAIPAATLERGWRAVWWALAALVLGIGLAGRDLVGTTVHHWIGGYSLIAWTMAVLWGTALVLSYRRFRVWEAAELPAAGEGIKAVRTHEEEGNEGY